MPDMGIRNLPLFCNQSILLPMGIFWNLWRLFVWVLSMEMKGFLAQILVYDSISRVPMRVELQEGSLLGRA